MTDKLTDGGPPAWPVHGDYLIAGRTVRLLFDGQASVTGELVEDILAARAEGLSVVVGVVGGGGRSAIGRVLVRWSLARVELRQGGFDELADDLGVTWLAPDRDPAIRRWAAGLGIQLANSSSTATLESVTQDAWGHHGEWHIRPGEDRQLHRYWMKSPGTLWREVPVGGRDAKVRAIDAVIVPGDRAQLGQGPIPWDADGLQVVEVKRHLTGAVIGQVAAAGMAALEHGARDPQRVALVRTVDQRDEALRAVCKELSIGLVVEPSASTVIAVAVDPSDPLLSWLDGQVTRSGLLSRGEALLEVARSAAADDGPDEPIEGQA